MRITSPSAAQNDPSNRSLDPTALTPGTFTTTSATSPHYNQHLCPFSSLTRCESPRSFTNETV
jgi:hypothetical protein